MQTKIKKIHPVIKMLMVFFCIYLFARLLDKK